MGHQIAFSVDLLARQLDEEGRPQAALLAPTGIVGLGREPQAEPSLPFPTGRCNSWSRNRCGGVIRLVLAPTSSPSTAIGSVDGGNVGGDCSCLEPDPHCRRLEEDCPKRGQVFANVAFAPPEDLEPC